MAEASSAWYGTSEGGWSGLRYRGALALGKKHFNRREFSPPTMPSVGRRPGQAGRVRRATSSRAGWPIWPPRATGTSTTMRVGARVSSHTPGGGSPRLGRTTGGSISAHCSVRSRSGPVQGQSFLGVSPQGVPERVLSAVWACPGVWCRDEVRRRDIARIMGAGCGWRPGRCARCVPGGLWVCGRLEGRRVGSVSHPGCGAVGELRVGRMLNASAQGGALSARSLWPEGEARSRWRGPRRGGGRQQGGRTGRRPVSAQGW